MVRETWASLRAQTLADFEVLVLDNASDDAGHATLADLVASEPRARLLRIDDRVPVFANFERGRAAARGEFLTYFHDDDIYLPEFLERSIEALRRDPDLVFTGSNCDYIDGQGRDLGPRNLVRASAPWTGRQYIATLYRLGRNPILFQSAVFRRSAVPADLFRDDGGPHCTDFVMLMRLTERAPMYAIADRLTRVRLHAAQGSAIAPSRSVAEMHRALSAYLDDLDSRGMFDMEFRARARRDLERAVRFALVLGWLRAESATEAAACARALEGGVAWRATGAMLKTVARTGAREPMRDSLLPTLRRWLRRA